MSSQDKSHRCPACKEPVEPPGGDEVRRCPLCMLPIAVVAGKYEIQKVLSQGGCGVLYLAKHQRLQMDPIRVIKFIKPEFIKHEKTIKRLAREVEVTAALSQKNEHIVRVYDDFGEIEALGSYYVMEYLQGGDLAMLLDEYPTFLPYKRIYHIFKQVLQAIGEAHIAGVVHRDLKPQNIFLTQRGDDADYVKVIDFGIAKNLDIEDQTKLTQGALGTPEYMAPEQVQGKEIDGRTDIYALGIILYEMVTGFTPFLPPHETKAVPTQIALSHVMKQAPPPSKFSKRKIPERLEAIIMRALNKDKDERYQSAADFLSELVAFEASLDRESAAIAARLSQRPEIDDEDDQTFQARGEELLSGWNKPPLPSAEHSPPEAPTPASGSWEDQATSTTSPWLTLLLGLVVLGLMGLGAFVYLRSDAPPVIATKPPARATLRPTAGGSKRVEPVQARRPEPRLPKPRPERAKPAPARRPRARRSTRPTPRRAKRRSKRRITRAPRKKRRLPPPARRSSGVAGCKQDTPTHLWLRFDLSPPSTRLQARGLPTPEYHSSHLCLRKARGKALPTLVLTNDGYSPCIVPLLSGSKRRVRIRLKKAPTHKQVDPPMGYCLK